MKQVQLADRLGNIQIKKVGFSWLHFFFGPIYSICTGHIFIALGELLAYYLLSPIPGMEYLCSLLTKLTFIPSNVIDIISKVLLYFRGFPQYIVGGVLLLIMHISISRIISSLSLRRYMKRKELRPAEEKDARILIRHKAASIDIGLADSFDIRTTSNFKSAEQNWYENNQNRITSRPTFETRQNLIYTTERKIQVQIEQLKNIYDLGLISKEEYYRRLKKIKEK